MKKLLEKLNGWQRIGVIVSALWTLVCCYGFVLLACSVSEGMAAKDVCLFTGIIVGLILLGWLAGFSVIWSVRWVYKGFHRA
jgi:hypothetical protein